MKQIANRKTGENKQIEGDTTRQKQKYGIKRWKERGGKKVTTYKFLLLISKGLHVLFAPTEVR